MAKVKVATEVWGMRELKTECEDEGLETVRMILWWLCSKSEGVMTRAEIGLGLGLGWKLWLREKAILIGEIMKGRVQRCDPSFTL